MKEKFKPLLDRVVVKRAHIPTDGDLVIPEKYIDLPDRGRVIAVGPGRPGVPMKLKVGDKVLLDKNADLRMTKINDEDFLILYEAEIAGTLE